MYQSSCVLGPRIWLTPGLASWPELGIHVRIERASKMMFDGETSTLKLHRTLPDLVEHLGRAKSFPRGAILLTGTGVVPPDSFTLEAGDVVTIRIDPIGTLTNPVIRVGRKA
jgi:2-dehydro-3-deoxy-D-arabinonate dehydratase